MGYEIIGNKEKAIAIIESSKSLKKDKQNAKEILKKSKSIKSILVKTSERKGKLRKRKYKLLAGEKNTEVTHKEYGYLIKLDPQKTYFSPRELTERQRIANQIKKNEKILVMFSGVAPSIVAIKKKQPSCEVFGIELNTAAHKFALQNIQLNKLSNITLIKGNVTKIVPKLKIKFNRILMPLPKTSNKFLSLALKKIKKNGVIHYYSWGTKQEFKRIREEVREIAKNSKKNIKILRTKKVLPCGPRTYKIAIDLKCLN
ncbi:MAG: hypothetical protein ABIB47_06855 [Candidatus Woesearchaeota archaeon]